MTDVAMSAEAKTQASRKFLIGIMMSILISLAVFAVATFYFVIPRLYDHEKRVNELSSWVKRHEAEHNAASAPPAVAEAAPAEAAAAPVADAPPADAPAAK